MKANKVEAVKKKEAHAPWTIQSAHQLPPFADSKYGGFPGILSSAPPYLFKGEFILPKKFARSCFTEAE